MAQRLFVIPQPKVGAVAGTTATQLTLAASLSSPAKRYAQAFIFEIAVNITGTAPGTARDLSQIVNYIEITDENGYLTHLDGQSLILSSLDTARRTPEVAYQCWCPTVTAATGVNAVGQYSVTGPFAGTVFNIVVGLNAATATGYTSPSAASYTVTCNLVEMTYEEVYLPTGKTDANGNPQFVSVPQPIRRFRINGRYVVNSQYTGKLACHSAIIAIDNAELSTKVSSIKVGGNNFSAQQSQMAEDGLDAFLPGGYVAAYLGTAFTGNATVPLKNVQTGNSLGAGEFGGPNDAIVEVSLNASATMLILERVPI